MPIFQDSQGLAVKFFIQKDLSQQIQAELCETITSLGGRVESKVPRQGYLLVQPSTPEEERLRLCWTSSDRPERHFVPYTYVEACKIAGMLLKQIFIHEGEPIKMHIHPSIANVNARAALSQRIMHSGGDPTASAQSARVILADPNTEVFQHLVKVYQGIPDKFIESYLWVRKCVEKGSIVYTPLVYKNPGGRRPGEERTQFTEEDEEHLCDWIAAKIPYKETGGRTGNRLYQQLCEMAHDPEYAWVSRHTWQSWRERYKKNASRLDAMIASVVDQKKPIQGEKGQYGYVRKAEDKPKRPRKKRVTKSSNAGGSKTEHALLSDEELVGGTSEGMRPVLPMPGMWMESMPPTASVPSDSIAVRKSPAEEEMDDGDEGSEWAVRVGDATPPPWGKRKTSQEADNDVSKRQRRSETLSAENMRTWQAATPMDSELHMVDQSIQDIASQYRFTVEEVKEYYDKFGDMERTRTRFMNMREELHKRFHEDDPN